MAAAKAIEAKEADCVERLAELLRDPPNSDNPEYRAEILVNECLKQIEEDLQSARRADTAEQDLRDLEKVARRISDVVKSAEAVLFEEGRFSDVATLAERASEDALIVFRLAREHPEAKHPKYLELLATAEKVLMQRSAGHYATVVLSSSADIASRSQAAIDLRRFGIWLRHDGYSRGTLREAVPSRGGELERKVRDPLPQLSALVSDRKISRELRINVAAALGEFGGPKEGHSILNTLLGEIDEDIVVALITALGVIGGPSAVSGFAQALAIRSELVRRAVVTALEELLARKMHGDPQLPGASKPCSEVHKLHSALGSVVDDPSCSEYLRVRAREMMYSLEPDTRSGNFPVDSVR
jgi:HEAT repeat protein